MIAHFFLFLKSNFHWGTQSSIKFLGAHFTYNKQLDEKKNFYQLIVDSRTLLNTWKQRWLSLAGKIQTFKSLIASKPVCIVAMKNTPPMRSRGTASSARGLHLKRQASKYQTLTGRGR